MRRAKKSIRELKGCSFSPKPHSPKNAERKKYYPVDSGEGRGLFPKIGCILKVRGKQKLLDMYSRQLVLM